MNTTHRSIIAAAAVLLLFAQAVLPALAAPEGFELEPQLDSLDYDHIGRFSEGVAPVQRDNLWGYIDTLGQLAIPLTFESEEAHPFSEGMAYVESIGFVDWAGEILIAGDFAQALSFSEGLAAVSQDGALWGFIDRNGAQAISARYAKVTRFSAGAAFVLESGAETGCFVDRDRSPVFETRYEDSNGFAEGLAAVKSGGLWGYLNRVGEQVIPFTYSKAESFSDGLALVTVGSGETAERFYIDTAGNRVLAAEGYDATGAFWAGLAPVSLNGAHGMIDREGNVIIELEYQAVNPFSESYAALRRDGLWAIFGKAPFVEIPSIWAVGQVNTAINVGIVPPALQADYGDTTTRAEFCALALCLYERLAGDHSVESSPFLDTDDATVGKLASLSVVQGVGEGCFEPDAPITREQAATLMARLAEAVSYPLEKGAPTFADSDEIANWALEAVGQMQRAEIMGGMDSTFAPTELYTREQSIVAMLRLYALAE